MNRSRLAWLAALALGAGVISSGCVRRAVDTFVAERAVDRALKVSDVGKACSMGQALANAIAATTRESRPPRRAMVIAETTAGLCDEVIAWEADLDEARATQNFKALDDGRIAEVKDARLREDRSRARAADRFYRAWRHAEGIWGPIGEGACPRVRKDDEIVYLLALFSGTMAMLHDKASGGTVGVPLDTLNKVARGSVCVDTDRWWRVPSALQAAAWATVPGTAPEGVDPWAKLRLEAEAGQSSGVRLGWGLYALVTANAGREEALRQGIRAHSASLAETDPNSDWLLLDRYAYLLTLHESDLIWVKEAGHRTSELGALPGDGVGGEESPGVFDEDPFAEDPFESDPLERPSTDGDEVVPDDGGGVNSASTKSGRPEESR